MCGGGPLFEDSNVSQVAPDQPDVDAPSRKAGVIDPLVLAAIKNLRNLLKDQAKRDFHSLRGYIDAYSTRADNLELQVGKWCDELDAAAIEQKRSVNSYLRRYDYLENEQDALAKRVRILKHIIETRQTSAGCSKTCERQNGALSKRIKKMEGKVQALETQCEMKENKLKSLITEYDALKKETVRSERENQRVSSSAHVPLCKPETAGPTVAELEDRLASLSQTVDLYGLYFNEIRDRIVQQEREIKEFCEFTNGFPESKDLRDRIEEVVACVYKRGSIQELQQIKTFLDKWATGIEKELSCQAHENDYRYKTLTKVGKSLASKISKSKNQAESAIANMQYLLESQIEAHSKASDVEITTLVAGVNETLSTFQTELQEKQIAGLQNLLAHHTRQLEHLHSQQTLLEARLNVCTTSQTHTNLSGPILPPTPGLQATPVPA